MAIVSYQKQQTNQVLFKSGRLKPVLVINRDRFYSYKYKFPNSRELMYCIGN